ncbi:mercury resistance system transport protein MerF [Nitrospira sp. Kam-Ns4a]
MEEQSRSRWIWIGGIGAGLAALCCFTPVLVLLLGAVGLAALTGYLDYVLLPVLLVSLGILVYGLSGPRAGAGHQCCADAATRPSGTDRAREVKHG